MEKRHIKFIFSYLKQYKLVWVMGIVFTIISIFLKIKYNWIMKDLIDEALIKRNLNLLIKLSILFPLLVILSCFFGYLKEYTFSFVTQKLIAKMRKDIFTHLLHLPYNFFLRNAQGDIINRIINDTEHIQRAFTDYIVSLISSVFTIIIVLIWLFYINTNLAVIVLIVVPIFAITSQISWKRMQHWGKLISIKTSDMTSYIQQILQSIELIKLTKNKNILSKKFFKICDDWSKSNLKLVMNKVTMNSLWESILTPYQAVIFLFGGIWYIKNGTPSIGTMVAFIDYLNLLIPAMLTLINEIPVVAQGGVSVIRVYEYLQETPEISGIELLSNHADINIEFKNVSFKHPNTKFSIENLSFTIKNKEFTTIIGTTGSGKSTIAKLLVRLFDPNSGTILINKKDIQCFDLEDLRGVISLIQQDTYLLHGTIKDNLLLDSPELPLQEIYNTLHLLALDKFIEQLPLKLDTLIEDRGANFSGGEKQRLSIARAVLKKPKIIILDEATSALDLITEEKILNNLKPIFAQATAIAIDHNLVTLKDSNKILVISNGQIIEQGTLNELIDKDGYLKRLLVVKNKNA